MKDEFIDRLDRIEGKLQHLEMLLYRIIDGEIDKPHDDSGNAYLREFGDRATVEWARSPMIKNGRQEAAD